MNSLPPLSLPRFHVNALKQPQKGQTAATPGLPPEDGFDLANEAPVVEPEIEGAPPEDTPESMAAMPPEIDTGMILNSLEAAVSGLERAALNHSQTMVSDFLRAAFPKLCEAFLAEEITTAANAIAPRDIARLNVTVPAAFEASFQRAIQASPKMTEICELQTQTDGPIIVDVDWGTGGLNFNMDQFLEASLARMNGPAFTQEGQDV